MSPTAPRRTDAPPPARGPAASALRLAATLMLLCLTLLAPAGAAAGAMPAPAGTGSVATLGPVRTEEPLDLTDTLVDEAGVIGDESAIRAAQARLLAEHGKTLYIVFVDDLSGWDGEDWVVQSARRSGFGDDDYLLVVGVQDRRYGFTVWADDNLTANDRVEIQTDWIEPHLGVDDWSGAAIAAADGTGEVLGNQPSGGRVLATVGGIFALALGGIGTAFAFIRRQFAKRRAAVVERAQQVDRTIVALDDALTQARQEATFAGAQFGPRAELAGQAAVAQAEQLAQEVHQVRSEVLLTSAPALAAAQKQLGRAARTALSALGVLAEQQGVLKVASALTDPATSAGTPNGSGGTSGDGQSPAQLAERLRRLSTHLADVRAMPRTEQQGWRPGLVVMAEALLSQAQAHLDAAATLAETSRVALDEGRVYDAALAYRQGLRELHRAEHTVGRVSSAPASFQPAVGRLDQAARRAGGLLDKAASLAALIDPQKELTYLRAADVTELQQAGYDLREALARVPDPTQDPRAQLLTVSAATARLQQIVGVHQQAKSKREQEAKAKRWRTTGSGGSGSHSSSSHSSSSHSSSGGSRSSGGGRF